MDVVMKFPRELGLRLPTESTWHLLASMWMVAHGADGFKIPMVKKTFLEKLKKEYRKTVRRCPVIELIYELPDALRLAERYPELYASIYTVRGDPPINCPIETDTIQFDQSFAVRGDPAKVSEGCMAVTPYNAAGSAGGPGGSLIDQIMPMMLQLVKGLSRGGGTGRSASDDEEEPIPDLRINQGQAPRLRKASTFLEDGTLLRFGKSPRLSGGNVCSDGSQQSVGASPSPESVGSPGPAGSPPHRELAGAAPASSNDRFGSAHAATEEVPPIAEMSMPVPPPLVVAEVPQQAPAEISKHMPVPLVVAIAEQAAPKPRAVELFEMLSERDDEKKEEAKKRKRELDIEKNVKGNLLLAAVADEFATACGADGGRLAIADVKVSKANEGATAIAEAAETSDANAHANGCGCHANGCGCCGRDRGS